MYIKKRSFNYPEIKNNKIIIGDLNLEGFDEAITHGVLLIVRIGRYYNFYLPSLEDGDRFTGNVFSIFNTVEEYVYEQGLLFIKQKEDSTKGNWIVLEPNLFSWYLSDYNLAPRKAAVPRIPYENCSNLEVLNFKHSHGFFVKVNNFNYWIEYKNSFLDVIKLDGSIRDSKIFNSVILYTPFGESFFINGEIDSKYCKIQELAPIYSNLFGYLCFCDSGCKQIKALKVGKTIPTPKKLDYSYTIEFEKPIKSIKFLDQKNLKPSNDVNNPAFAIHIWLIETYDGQQQYLLQGIGEYQFCSIMSKKDLII